MKRCPACKKVKSFSEFYKDKYTNSGLKAYCKSCTKIRGNKYYSENVEKIILRNHKYKNTPSTRIVYLDLLRKRRKIYSQKVKNKLRINAVARVNIAVKRGKLNKPKICYKNKDCKGRIEGHHYLGYKKEHWFDIKWLCRKHHTGIHNEQREIKAGSSMDRAEKRE